ncbi:hypothetical protein [uncultured Roseobacter sp.]|uniref:hypothetical protein n=1 Tax=uncultured Roseobacter sp. TaxID=114847 RepID=UPI00260445F1|nr:hypothetical protein [uncultured Roseobacter sp.]
MFPVYRKLADAAHRRKKYLNTFDELRRMDRATAIDLGMFPEDAKKVAYNTVYGD